MFVMF